MLKLKNLTSFVPSFQYHSKVQGFIYTLLRNTSFEGLHDKKGSKFFSFSNIFSEHGSPERLFNLIIASPSERFINELTYQLQKIIEYELPVEIGSLFELKTIKLIHNNNVIFPLKVITGSPIIIRIPLSRFMDESVNSAPYKSVYWRSSHPTNLFIEALESNLRKKYYQFTGKSITDRIFTEFEFKKQVSTKLLVEDRTLPVIGTLWRFTFSNAINKGLQLFALECGLGERNSLGFGFMNPVMQKQVN